MPRTEAQKRAQQKYLKKWREANREKYNEMQRKYQTKYNRANRDKKSEYDRVKYYQLKHGNGQEPMSYEEFIEQFDGEILTDDEGGEGEEDI